mgnify:CR=1 FL=1
MKLETVEKKLHIAYPQACRSIYESGAMRWMCGRPQAQSHFFPNQLLETMCPEYCRGWSPLLFSDVVLVRENLMEQVQEHGGQWKEGVQILPFAWDDDGDIYFFDAALEDPEAPVFAWMKFSGEIGLPTAALSISSSPTCVNPFCMPTCQRTIGGSGSSRAG